MDKPSTSLTDHPAIAGVITTPLTGWELYRARNVIRARFFRAMSKDHHLHIWAILERIGGPEQESLGEDEARTLAGILAGEWGVGKKLGQAVADGIRDYAKTATQRALPDFKSAVETAVGALVRLADHYAPETEAEDQ